MLRWAWSRAIRVEWPRRGNRHAMSLGERMPANAGQSTN
ncbi:hypothetical protein RHECNPAF_13300180 [Rhizobium etli CNPAF512]|nr:hypothetical protein RHECNPAF_13300180 [Rhizobium etli CNPAF512]